MVRHRLSSLWNGTVYAHAFVDVDGRNVWFLIPMPNRAKKREPVRFPADLRGSPTHPLARTSKGTDALQLNAISKVNRGKNLWLES